MRRLLAMTVLTVTCGTLALAFSESTPHGSGHPGDGGPNAPPIADPGGPYLNLECQGAQTTFQADGTGSFDPDGDPLSYFWRAECACTTTFDDPTSATPRVTVEAAGKCDVVCFLVLTVTAGGESAKAEVRYQVVDTTVPVLSMSSAPDRVEVWSSGYPTQLDPTLVGTPTVFDCDPSVSLVSDDVLIPGTMPGDPELIVERTYTATDSCGNQAQATQVLTLLSGSPTQPVLMDLMPDECPNLMFPFTASETAVIHGQAGLSARMVQPGSILVHRADGEGQVVRPITELLMDGGTPPAIGCCGLGPCCGSASLDGIVDVVVMLDRNEMDTNLLLEGLPQGDTVELVFRGRTVLGKAWEARQCVGIF